MRTISNETADWALDIALDYVRVTEGSKNIRTLNNCRKARKLAKRLWLVKTKQPK